MEELSGVIEDVDEQEYHTDSKSEEEVEKCGYVLPTPPRPREEAGAFQVILDHDVNLNLTEYFTESNEEEEEDVKQPWLYKQQTSSDCVLSQDLEIYYSDQEEENSIHLPNDVTDCDINDNSILNGTSESAYEGDISTYATDTTLDTKRRKRIKNHNFAPILRTAYYGRKRLTVGKRHFFSSVIEYSMGASLGFSSRKIPFYSLLVSPMKPKTKNKLPGPARANVLCDTSASISLAPLLIAKELKMKIDNS